MLSKQEALLKRLIQEQVERIVSPEMVVLLDDCARGIRQILTHLRETTPEGEDVPIPEKTVTGTQTINLIREYPYRPLRKVDFFNKGPNTAYYRINNNGKEIPIEDRETIVVERPRATIKTITLRVDAGNSATIKMIGSY